MIQLDKFFSYFSYIEVRLIFLWQSYLKQRKNESERRKSLVSIFLLIEDTLEYKIVFFKGFEKNILYICKKI
jgi:hypothetical protein